MHKAPRKAPAPLSFPSPCQQAPVAPSAHHPRAILGKGSVPAATRVRPERALAERMVSPCTLGLFLQGAPQPWELLSAWNFQA